MATPPASPKLSPNELAALDFVIDQAKKNGATPDTTMSFTDVVGQAIVAAAAATAAVLCTAAAAHHDAVKKIQEIGKTVPGTATLQDLINFRRQAAP